MNTTTTKPDRWLRWFHRLFRRSETVPQPRNVWHTEREQTLGTYVHYGDDVYDIRTMYRIAVFERCLITGATRIRERTDMCPAVS